MSGAPNAPTPCCPAPSCRHSARHKIRLIFLPRCASCLMISGDIICSSCIQDADWTLTTRVPSRRTSRGVVTSAILAPTSRGHSEMTLACCTRRLMPCRSKYCSRASPSGTPRFFTRGGIWSLLLKSSSRHSPARPLEENSGYLRIARRRHNSLTR